MRGCVKVVSVGRSTAAKIEISPSLRNQLIRALHSCKCSEFAIQTCINRLIASMLVREVEIRLLFENGESIFENTWRQYYWCYSMRNHGRLGGRNITRQ